MLKVYGCYKSRATRVLWLAEELELAFEHIPVVQAVKLADPLAADAPINTQSPAFLAINPFGAIPAIEDDGLVLFESLAITLYLAKQYGGEMGPKDLEEDAQMMQWALFAATEIESNALKISRIAADQRLESEAGKAEAEVAARLLKRPLAVLEAYFSKNDFAVADRFTVADINLAEVVRYAQPYTPLMEAHPRLAAWLTRMQARPAFKAMWEKRAKE
ncbi:glutathione S-transferase family protein [Allorhizobium sp. BGMRC 0089]|uniref:glutathione S-transferase family protein n=1 Tax=Allorhizobium sonneratiae TaxID=2934936 RepID=UPI0020339FE1|nr:glutathione S-transferase family protein [Allorhizobium sonneratiae]MCM2291838.1 glutathione S-transferase family protein [Allorhizobium sonneratiae]